MNKVKELLIASVQIIKNVCFQIRMIPNVLVQLPLMSVKKEVVNANVRMIQSALFQQVVR